MNPLSFIRKQIIKLGNLFFGRVLSTGKVFNLTSPEVYETLDQSTAIQKGFNTNIAVYVVVKKDAVRFGSIPRYVYQTDKKEEKSVSALTQLINRPNPYQSQDAFYTLVRASYKVCGEAFIWLNRGDLEPYRTEYGFDDDKINKLPVLEMYVLPPDRVAIIPDPKNLWGCLGYYLDVGERVAIRAGDVIHWKDVNLSFDAASRMHLRGMSPATPGSKTISEGESIIKASLRMAQNDGAKAVLFSETENITPEQQSQLKRVIDAKINNNDIAGSVATLQGKWGLLDLSMSSRDMQMIDKKKMNWHEIALLYGVPPEYVVTDQKYDNMRMATIQWLNDSIVPACKQLDGEMNRYLPKAFGLDGKAYIATDVTDIPELMEYMIEIAEKMQKITSITPDEIREYLGYEKLGGEFSKPWVNGAPYEGPIDEELEEMGLLDSVNGQGY